MTYSVIITEESHMVLQKHLIRSDWQEDLCFATYVPSTGSSRATAIISEIILPADGDRNIHHNVGFMPCYFEKALETARQKGEGLTLLHSHLGPGWQGMSEDDITAEMRIAPAAAGATKLPLLGLTIGTDGAWSGRFWIKDPKVRRKYDRFWCETVRVLGKQLSITYNDDILPAQFDSGKQLRTISAWGKKTQEDLSRLKVGIVGLGSVGSIVAEILARTGISDITLIDFDRVEEKNLDRLTNVFKEDIGKAKVATIASRIKRSATSPNVKITCCEFSICEKEGYLSALDCDILFSCVDRPWPRQVLNFIAYAHLMPVIDGGILVRTNQNNTAIKGADWKAQTVGYQRACLECVGQYSSENAALEISGFLDDPEYIKGLDKASSYNAHENVFTFGSHLASMEVLQMLRLVISPSGISDVGQQMHHFVTGTQDIKQTASCHESCFFPTVVGRGDFAGVTVYAKHEVAIRCREIRNSQSSLPALTGYHKVLRHFKNLIFRLIFKETSA